MCKFRPLEERYDDEFLCWVGEKMRLVRWMNANFPAPADLSFEDWEALAVIKEHNDARQLKALFGEADE